MSAFAGILSLDAANSDPASPDVASPGRRHEALASMASALSAHGPDGGRSLVDGPISMSFAAFHVTADSRRSSQPLEEEHIRLTWDGRLDNRAELGRLLDTENAPAKAANLPDAVLVARLYAALGVDVVHELVGDFAFALWDARARRLVLARDAMGARTIFYRREGGTLRWASTLGAVLAAERSEPAIDEEWLGAYLLRLMPAEQTPFRDILQVPPGSMLLAEPGPGARLETRLVEHWTLGRHEEIRYSRDADYEEHFRQLFFDAVRSRMRTGGAPICCELSGGLDSSSIACVAHHLLRTESVEAGDVFTYSIVYDRASSADEREFIGAVERRLGKPGLHLLEDEHPMLAGGFEKPWAEIPYFLQTLRAPHVHAGRELAKSGTRMVLTGAGGDQLMWNDIEAPYYLADLATERRPRELWRQLGAWRRRPACSQYPQPLPQLILRGLLRPLLASRRGRSRPHAAAGLRPYLGRELLSLYEKYWRRNNPALPGIRPSRLPPIEELRDVAVHVGWFYHFERLGFQMSHPFLHRPLVEFCLGIPNEQFVRVDETRSLQRRALRDLLPPEVAQRYGKVGPDEAVLRGLRREWSTVENLLDGSRVCERGLADRELLLAALERARGGLAPCNMDLVRLLEVEIWLRGREASPLALAA